MLNTYKNILDKNLLININANKIQHKKNVNSIHIISPKEIKSFQNYKKINNNYYETESGGDNNIISSNDKSSNYLTIFQKRNNDYIPYEKRIKYIKDYNIVLTQKNLYNNDINYHSPLLKKYKNKYKNPKPQSLSINKSKIETNFIINQIESSYNLNLHNLSNYNHYFNPVSKQNPIKVENYLSYSNNAYNKMKKKINSKEI